VVILFRSPVLRLIQITDLHLSDRIDTPGADALRWAIDTCNLLIPDLVVFTGDVTTYGTSASARQFLDHANRLTVPWVFTPGNAELRLEGAMTVLAECASRKAIVLEGIHFLLPDTSSGRITDKDRIWLDKEARSDGPLVLLTHYPIDTLDADSRVWIEAWLSDHPIELYLAGHRHFTRSRTISGCLEVITRGLDPDKAFGGPPGISLFERRKGGRWSEQVIPWPHENDLLPAEVGHSPVGWSIHGDPVETVRETFDFGLNVLELRPRTPDYDLAAAVAELDRLRGNRPVYLSWHLPSVTWNDDDGLVSGQEAVARQIDHGRSCGVDAFTFHVPQVGAHKMFDGDEPSAVWDRFLTSCDGLFRETVADGVRLSIENVHNAPGTSLDPKERKFGTEIGEYESWLDSAADRIGEPAGRIGAHFDVGHARNNGALGNFQPLGDWYARIGKRITGYHIHQVRPHEETGKLTNHRDIKSPYDRTISYAGFLHAWSNKLINRAPMFVEVRDAEERRRTLRMLSIVFGSHTAS
jgi:sugar phosphate isomerase/epimerase